MSGVAINDYARDVSMKLTMMHCSYGILYNVCRKPVWVNKCEYFLISHMSSNIDIDFNVNIRYGA